MCFFIIFTHSYATATLKLTIETNDLLNSATSVIPEDTRTVTSPVSWNYCFLSEKN